MHPAVVYLSVSGFGSGPGSPLPRPGRLRIDRGACAGTWGAGWLRVPEQGVEALLESVIDMISDPGGPRCDNCSKRHLEDHPEY